MTTLSQTTFCHMCPAERARHRNQCIYCGSRLEVGRTPSRAEQNQSMRERMRDARGPTMAESKAFTDWYVLGLLGESFQPFSEISHTDIVMRTSGKVNACAAKHALLRLENAGAVAKAYEVQKRRCLVHTIWQVIDRERWTPAEVRGIYLLAYAYSYRTGEELHTADPLLPFIANVTTEQRRGAIADWLPYTESISVLAPSELV